MPIEFIQDGDLFKSGCDALVNPVNCVGVSGKGLALEFKNRFPDNHFIYAQRCRDGFITPGCVFTVSLSPPKRWIFNVATKNHWREPSQLSWIETALAEISSVLGAAPKIKSIAIPALGCGNGGLDWKLVRPMMEKEFAEVNCMVKIYEPQVMRKYYPVRAKAMLKELFEEVRQARNHSPQPSHKQSPRAVEPPALEP